MTEDAGGDEGMTKDDLRQHRLVQLAAWSSSEGYIFDCLLGTFKTVLAFCSTDATDAQKVLGALDGVTWVDVQAACVKVQNLKVEQSWPFLGPTPSLAHVCTQILGHPIDKSNQMGPWNGDLDQERILYAWLDSYVLLQLWKKIGQNCRNLG
eukprot:229826-Rhodomonas_salina.2